MVQNYCNFAFVNCLVKKERSNFSNLVMSPLTKVARFTSCNLNVRGQHCTSSLFR